jgi:digeranylgeranylglycerophospholipid reductase
MDYDAVVIGTGPAGSIAAKTIAELGGKVLLVEKRPEIGVPVRCAEGVGKGLEKIIKIEDKFVAKKIYGEYIYSPDGNRLEIIRKEPTGYVLERRAFDKSLAIYAAKAGAEVKVRTYAIGLVFEKFVKVRLKHFDEEYEVECGVVVGADGIEGKVGRWAGLSNMSKVNQMTSNVQYEMVGLELENPDVMEFYLGKKIAPGGYAWIFPKGEDYANVGIGIRSCEEPAYTYLNKFILSKENLRNGRKIGVIVGGVPVEGPLRKTVRDGLILVGDAARHVDPLTGGGIYNAMCCGAIAGKVIKSAIEKRDFSERTLMKYETEWKSTIGKGLERSLKIREALEKLSDEDLNEICKIMKKLDFKISVKDLSCTKLPPEVLEFVKML